MEMLIWGGVLWHTLEGLVSLKMEARMTCGPTVSGIFAMLEHGSAHGPNP